MSCTNYLDEQLKNNKEWETIEKIIKKIEFQISKINSKDITINENEKQNMTNVNQNKKDNNNEQIIYSVVKNENKENISKNELSIIQKIQDDEKNTTNNNINEYLSPNDADNKYTKQDIINKITNSESESNTIDLNLNNNNNNNQTHDKNNHLKKYREILSNNNIKVTTQLLEQITNIINIMKDKLEYFNIQLSTIINNIKILYIELEIEKEKQIPLQNNLEKIEIVNINLNKFFYEKNKNKKLLIEFFVIYI